MTADALIRFGGYRDSPLDGGPYAPIDAIAALLAEHGIARVRVVGIPSEYAAGAAARGERIVERGGPWLDHAPVGFRSTRVCRSVADVRRSISAAELDGFNWLPIGHSLDPSLVAHAVALANHHGMRVLLEGRHDLDGLDLTGVASVDGLSTMLVAPGASPGTGLVDLGRNGPDRLRENLQSIADAEVPLVPLLAALRRAHLLDEVVNASGLERLCDVLPYHRRILELRSPAAHRFGRRHAERYLQMPRLSSADRRDLQTGWSILGTALSEFVDARGLLAIGSGSPGTGLCPGPALAEEQALWTSAGLDGFALDDAARRTLDLTGSWVRPKDHDVDGAADGKVGR